MKMRGVVVCMAVLLSASCDSSNSGSPTSGGTWKQQAFLQGTFFNGVFDRDGNFVVGNHSFDPKLDVWSKLGGVGTGVADPFLDLEGNVYGYSQPDQIRSLHRLDGLAWTLLFELPANARLVTFGTGGAMFAAGWESAHFFIYRRGQSGWDKTFEGPADGDVKEFYSDARGNMYLVYAGGTLLLSPTGDALDVLFDCAGQQLWPYCNAEVGAVGVSPENDLLYVFDKYYKASSPTVKPTVFGERSKTFWIGEATHFQRGNLFTSAKKVTGETSSLLRLGWGDSEFSEVAEMPCFGCAFRVRDDGTVFSYDGRGALWRLER